MAWRRTSSTEHTITRMRSRDHADPEKEAYSTNGVNDDDSPEDYEDHDYSEASSRSVSSSNQPMLSKAFSSRPRPSVMLRLPNSIMRWICWGLAAMLLMFMLSLVKMSWASDKAVQVAILQDKISPKPPMWESFPFLARYWGGIRTLVPYAENSPEYPIAEEDVAVQLESPQQKPIPKSQLFDPYPNYTSPEYIREYGEKIECFLDAQETINIPRVRMYEGRTSGFPEPIMGSPELLGMRHDICYERFGRLGPYGLGYSLSKGGSGAMQEGEREGSETVWSDYPEVDFRQVKWAEVQDRCFKANAHRFKPSEQPPAERFRTMQIGAHAKRDSKPAQTPASSKVKEYPTGEKKIPRTAVIIRTWFDYDYTPEDLIYLRSLVSELSLLTGGEYTLHFLIQVKDDNSPIWTDEDTYERFLYNSLPEEFRGMGTLWTERQMALMYPGLEETFMRGLPVHGVYRSTFMPLQYFAYQHPEYDFFWNWEMDVRNTGHWYHLFDRVSKWAKAQPRKYLWERNGRFYIPFKHGSWEDFTHMVRIQTEHGTNSANNLWSGIRAGGKPSEQGNAKIQGDRSIWGPERPELDDIPLSTDPLPPSSFEKDKNEWGVDEEADLITFNPMFDPDGTTWLLADDTTGYNNEKGRPPRRTAIITASRLSRKLLMTMHRETSTKRHTMFSEMWPASCALQHGLKAVYAPHAEYIDRRWPIDYLDATFNAGRNGATGGSRTSVFGEREHNFRGTTWYYNAGFPEVLWHRWLGMRFNNDGGEVEELGGEGRMCLPGMLLHPVKRVELPQEGRRAE